MQLKLNRTPKNKYPLKGILIKGNSPAIWLHEMECMRIQPELCAIYALPLSGSNEVFGCLVVFKNEIRIKDIRQNSWVQSIKDKIFIPEYSDVYPALTEFDFINEFSVFPYFFHPATHLVELNETIDWFSFITLPTPVHVELKIPEEGIAIPSKILAFKAVINPDSWMTSISETQTEDEWYKNLPFNMKKLLDGNKNEMQKFLAFLKNNPDMALKYAIPLDIMGSNRGKQLARYIFKNDNWWNKLLDKLFTFKPTNKPSGTTGQPQNGKSSSSILFIVAAIIIILTMFRTCSSLIVGSGSPLIWGSVTASSFFRFALILFFIFCIIYIIIIYLSLINEYKSQKSNSESSNLDSSSEGLNIGNLDTFDLSIHSEQPKYAFARNISLVSRIMLMITLSVSLTYLFLPLSIYAGWTNWFTLVAIAIMLYCSYRLIRTDMPMITSEEEKKKKDEQKFGVYNIIIYFLKTLVVISYLFTKGFFPFLGSLIIGVVLLLATTFIIVFLFSNNSEAINNNSGTVGLVGSIFDELTKQYEKLAQKYVERKDYSRAAYVYLKLLKNPYRAAEILFDGKQYLNAANVYLQMCKNKRKAAEAFEAARLYTKAIELYQEMNEDEKVGDLYMLLKEKQKAIPFYQKVISEYTSKNQFIKASLIFKNKLYDIDAAQKVLLQGWEEDKDAIKCINNYFSNIENRDQLIYHIQQIYKKHTPAYMKSKFLEAIKYEYKNQNGVEDVTREIAYQIIADLIQTKPAIIKELSHFTKNDKQVITDIMQYNLYNNI